MITEFKALPLDAKLSDAIELLVRSSQHEFPIVEADGRVRGVLTREDLVTALSTSGEDAAIADHMRRDVPTVPFYAPFEEAYRTVLEQLGAAELLRMDRAQRIVIPRARWRVLIRKNGSGVRGNLCP